MPKQRRVTPLIDRVMAKIAKTSCGCWIFVGSHTAGGYGHIGRGRRGDGFAMAHRVVYEHEVGLIPDGMQLDHLCRVRCCCNPAHLEPVTQSENILRGEGYSAKHARKTHCPKGHPYVGDNLIVYRGARFCRACRDTRNHARTARRSLRYDAL